MTLNGAEIIIGILEREGISAIAGIPGGSNLPLYDALGRSGIRHILARHEQAAGFIAQGMSRSSGNAAVCFATSGPGVTNLLTAIADAKLDSVPLVAITGQVPLSSLGTDAFQEIDTFGLSLPITKHSVMVRSAAELLEELPRAFKIARSGRPGPVLVDVPKDVQTGYCTFDAWPQPHQFTANPVPDPALLEAMAEMIERSERPLMYAGAGCAASDESAAALRNFSCHAGIPLVHTFSALGAADPDSILNLGMIGMHGGYGANRAAAECDLLIAAGARFDDRATGRLSAFAPEAKIIHIDIDASEIGKLRRPDLSVCADAGEVIRELSRLCRPIKRSGWINRITELRRDYPDIVSLPEDHPIRILRKISELMDRDAIISTDVGQHQMWAAQGMKIHRPRSFLSSGGLGTMGFGLPAAIGAALAHPGRQLISISGDGSVLMNIQELATLAELRKSEARVKLIIMDNGQLGLVRQQQELFYGRRYTASSFSVRPDFALIARGFGIPADDLALSTDPEAALKHFLESPGPGLLRIPVDGNANVYPMVPPGGANHEAVGSYHADRKKGQETNEEESA
ncbi:biosynthetic-type acetolactate synthase large subunit [Treponema sp. OttesenSCG-928-L16]|nr:biosynthetic-type acetolactate synthase large subunit [Treponema sp. OttesenSCG-928-L16]